MDRFVDYYITEEYANMPVSKLLAQHLYTGKMLTFLRKDASRCLINGKPSFLNTITELGDIIHISIPEQEHESTIVPIQLDFKIIYEDEDIIVVDKPSNMPIHPSLNNYTNSLANALSYYYQNEPSPFVFRCINRLDRDTSGLTVIAKNLLSASILYNMMKDRKIEKTYLAITSGIPKSMKGIIDKPIGRKAESCIERCIDYAHGEKAITHYEVLKTVNDSLALVSLKLETGRTHQIRVHMTSIGHPLIGDFLYNPADTTMKRQALHADTISFTHPITQKAMSFTSPLPFDMSSIIDYSIRNS